MEQPISRTSKLRRSRNGCRGCRLIHRKCDEQRPSCGRCLESGAPCSYQVVLSWGGRPFRKSAFGELAGVIPVEAEKQNSIFATDETPFVYGIRSKEKSGNEAPAESTLGYRPRPMESNIWRNPDWLNGLPPGAQQLLHHFATTTVVCIVLHRKLHFDFCSVIIPMALDRAYGNVLLAAILSAALAHRASLRLSCDEVPFAYLKQWSLQQLRRQLSHQVREPTKDDDVYIATSLTLAFCEMLEGGEKPNTWRAHLKGAAALLGVGQKQKSGLNIAESPSRALLRRWWQTYEGHTVFADRPVLLADNDHDSSSVPSASDDYIDDFHGFSVRLLPIIDELNLLIVEKEALKNMKDAGLDFAPFQNVIEQRTNKLVLTVKEMLENRNPRVHDAFNITNESFELADFAALDEAYHHITLLKIYQRVLGLRSTDVVVQEAVGRAIDCIRRITLHDFACPGVALLQPLFTVGCEAHNAEDRDFVLAWLDKLRTQHAMGNVDHSKEFLLELWERRDSMAGTGAYIHWNELHDTKGWELALY